MPQSDSNALLTDLYQLTMLQGYVEHDMEQTAVFEFFVRRLPASRSFLMACGLEQVLEYLEQLHFTPAELKWLRSSGRFRADFIDYLERLRFRGDVHALPEGEVFFADEPLIRVTASLPQAQLIESRVINLLHFQTLVASKAARNVLAAPEKHLVEFGMRRAHGAEAALLAARASYVAGFSGTSNVLAGIKFEIPLFGTMAHSFVQAHDSEEQAFLDFATSNPQDVVLLIDTYDTEAAARKVAALAPRLKAQGIRIKGVRIDSGDLAAHARNVRSILDAAGLKQATIFASSSLDEATLQDYSRQGAPIDGYGVGSRLDVSADAPYLDCAYKLQEYAGHARRKRSEGKATWPGRKQVYRTLENGRLTADVVSVEGDAQPGRPLLELVMHDGKRTKPPKPLVEIRRVAAKNLAQLPDNLRSIDVAGTYPVHISQALQSLAASVDKRTRRGLESNLGGGRTEDAIPAHRLQER